MVQLNKIILGGGTLVSAIGIGFFMQNAGASPARSVDVVPVQAASMMAAPQVELTDVTFTSVEDMPLVPDAGPAVPVLPETIQLAALDSDIPLPAMPVEEPKAGFACETVMEATPQAAAMVKLVLSGCHADARATIHHNGMMVSVVTDAEGVAAVTLPALSENAVFIADLLNGEGAVAQTLVTSFADYDRVVLQWKGDAGFQLHALEYGAGYADAGHIWSAAPGDIAQTVQGKGGFVTTVGDLDLVDGLRAEVYTFPAGAAGRAGDVQMSVEAEVTAANCGHEIAAQTLQVTGGAKLTVQDLTLAVPPCDAKGEFLVLKNLLQDMKIASN
jgi:hypothetical protein